MELRTHTTIIRNARWFIVVFTILVTAAAMVFAFSRPETYKAVVSFEVNFVNRNDTQEYAYGAYYDLRGGEIFVQHLMSLLRTPAVVEQIYKEADQGYEITSLARFTNRFQAKQYSAQNFSVELTDHNQDVARGLAQAIGTVIEQRSEQAGSVNEETVFEVRALEPVVAPSNPNPWFVTAAGAIVGLLASILLVYIKEYFRSSSV